LISLDPSLLGVSKNSFYHIMSTNSEKPVIAIVQGAWHRASHYQGLVESLTNKRFTVLQPDNVTAGDDEDIKGKTHLDDVEAIRKSLQPALNEGKRIVLVCHSYGGIPGSAAVEGYQIHEREAKGLSGGISHVVYIAAFALPVKGLSLLSAAGGTHGPFLDRTVSYTTPDSKPRVLLICFRTISATQTTRHETPSTTIVLLK
jgi:pimeloyl-ACP methyl ester carboxylesterase